MNEEKRTMTEEEKSLIPKFDDLMVNPELNFYSINNDKIHNVANGASIIPFTLMRSMAVNAATEPDYTDPLNKIQLREFGDIFLQAYSDNLKFYLSELIFNNIVMAIESDEVLVKSGFINDSDIRHNIYDAITAYDYRFNLSSIYYKLFRSTDNSRYVIDNEFNKNNPYYIPTNKEALLHELSIYGDLYIRNIYSNIMAAVDYSCNAYFYNFNCTRNPDSILSVVDNICKAYIPDNSPFMVSNKVVCCNEFVKSSISFNIQKLFGSFLNNEICRIISFDERTIPSDIFKSLYKIQETQDREMKENNNKITPIPHNLDKDIIAY